MTLNKVKKGSNMYPFLNEDNYNGYTWNPIRGRCSHDCGYCYMKVFPQGVLRLDEKSLKDDLGENNFIFVGSSCDMFAKDVPNTWVYTVLNRCNKFKNKYLFQSKDPERMRHFLDHFPKDTVLGTTIETNREGWSYKAPLVKERYWNIQQDRFPIMLTIEPIIDFDLDVLVGWVKDINPSWVNIGADSKNHGLIEPDENKIKQLIYELNKFTIVKIKSNLSRLMREG